MQEKLVFASPFGKGGIGGDLGFSQPNRALRSERLTNRVIRLKIRPTNQIDAVGYGGKNAVDQLAAISSFQAFQGFGNRLGLSG